MKKTVLCILIYDLWLLTSAFSAESGLEAKAIPAGNLPVSLRTGLVGDSGISAAEIATTQSVAQVAADLATETASRIADFETVSESIDFVAISRYTKDETDAAIETWTQAFVTNPVVQTVDAGDTNNVIVGSAVKNALTGIAQKDGRSVTNYTKLHILELSQSNGTKSGDAVSLIYRGEEYTNTIPHSWLNIAHYNAGTNTLSANYTGTNRIFASFGANVFAPEVIRDLMYPKIDLYFTHVGQGGAGIFSFAPNYVSGGGAFTNLLWGTVTNEVAITAAEWPAAGNVDVIWVTVNETDNTLSQYNTFLSNMRSQFGDDVKFVFRGRHPGVEGSYTDVYGTYTNSNDTYLMSLAKADPNIVYVSSKTLEVLTSDNIHFTNPSMLKTGYVMGSATVAVMMGLDFDDGFYTLNGYVDRLGSSVANIMSLRSGDLKVSGEAKIGRLDVDGVTISNNVIYNARLDGSEVVSPVDAANLQYSFEFNKAGADVYNYAFPLSGLTAWTTNSPVWSFDTTRTSGVLRTASLLTNGVSTSGSIGQGSNNTSFAFWFNAHSNLATKSLGGFYGASVNSSFAVHHGYAGTPGSVRVTCPWTNDTAAVGGTFVVNLYGDTTRTGMWQHVAAVIDWTNSTLSAYLNGVLVGTSSTNLATPSRGVLNGAFTLGRLLTVVGSEASYDKCHVWSRGLLSNEVYNLYLLERRGDIGVAR